MQSLDEQTVLRARDFWGGLVLSGLALFFLWRTSYIPLFGANRAGVSGADWYNSAALVPLGIFGGLFLLSLVLIGVSLKSGGAKAAFSAAGLGWDRGEAIRFTTLSVILFFYIAGLVPRVDFILCSGLLITSLIFGYHGGHLARMGLSAGCVAGAGAYAMVVHWPRAEWGAHSDDWVTLVIWLGLSGIALSRGRSDFSARLTPLLALLVPVVLVLAMAFGFRQNVPNRGGLLFKQIEYHYYVTLKPMWSQ